MGGFVIFLFFSALAFLVFIVCLAAKPKSKGRTKWLLQLIAIIFIPLYLVQISLVVPGSVSREQIQSDTSSHSVVLELKRGAYSPAAYIPFFGITQVSSRAVYLHTNRNQYLVWIGDNFDHPFLSDHTLEIQDGNAAVIGSDFTWRGTSEECLPREK